MKNCGEILFYTLIFCSFSYIFAQQVEWGKSLQEYEIGLMEWREALDNWELNLTNEEETDK